jgi:hypothetical protein
MHYIRPNAFSGAEADKNIGIPQVVFCENVMPTSFGYQSIDLIFPILGSAATDFDNAFYLRNSTDVRTLFVPAGGKCYIYDTANNEWDALNKIVPANAICSVANVKGRTFVHFAGDNEFFEWDGAALNAVTLTGLTPANILGLTSSNGYLIAWDADTIYHSSTLDPADFTPSLSTGAGSTKILGLKGRIIYCYQITDGFLIHSTVNAVYAFYSNNIRFPWVFKEILGASGIKDFRQVAAESQGNKIYVYSNDGMMEYDRVKAVQIFPALSEFLNCRKIETYNRDTKQIDVTDLVDIPFTKIAFVGNRWLVISYGQTATLSHALIYDSALKRWGKVRVDHVDCFEFFGNPGIVSGSTAVPWVGLVGSWAAQNNAWSAYGQIFSGGLSQTTTPYKTLAFLGADGKVTVVDFAHGNTGDVAIMMLGRIQYIRTRLTTLLDVTMEGMGQESQSKLAVMTSLDGTNISKEAYPMKVNGQGMLNKWQMRITGVNHTLRFEGNFQATTIHARTMMHGSR